MKTKSIYQGFLVHITVAGADGLALAQPSRRAAARRSGRREVDAATGLMVEGPDFPAKKMIGILVGTLASIAFAVAMVRAARTFRARALDASLRR